MSIALMASAWELDIPTTEKMVLLCLCDFANDEGECWPSRNRIAAKCSITDRSVRRSITGLEERGIVQRVPRFNDSTVYRLNVPVSGTGRNVPGGQKVQPGGTQSPRGGDTRSPKPSVNHKEPPKQKTAMPANWHPVEFAAGSKCRKIVDGWPPGDLEQQVEHFIALHTAKGSRFECWQAAWKTWVINSEKYGGNRGRQQFGGDKSTRTAAAAALARIHASGGG